jgi:hypothetical protein
MFYSEVRKANGIYLPMSRNILNFCSNLPAHALRDIITLLSEHPECQCAKRGTPKCWLRLDFSNDCIFFNVN